jgi:hypothetical protein
MERRGGRTQNAECVAIELESLRARAAVTSTVVATHGQQGARRLATSDRHYGSAARYCPACGGGLMKRQNVTDLPPTTNPPTLRRCARPPHRLLQLIRVDFVPICRRCEKDWRRGRRPPTHAPPRRCRPSPRCCRPHARTTARRRCGPPFIRPKRLHPREALPPSIIVVVVSRRVRRRRRWRVPVVHPEISRREAAIRCRT